MAALLAVCGPASGGRAQESRETPAAGATVPVRSEAGALRRHGTVFTVERFGRYAVRPVSVRGAALRLVDRMAGPGDEDGVPGGRDGRIDLFLGPGEHKAEVSFGAGEPRPPELAVQPFQELSPGTPPQLLELALVETELGDLQQRSWWLEIPRRRTVFIEAAGRHLQDLRLWRDGTWLVDAVPAEARAERDSGQPLAVRQLTADLAPGLYLLTAYGGAGETWSKAGAGEPLALRWGLPTLPEAGRRQFVAGPFGFDRWLVPGTAGFFRLELPRGEVGSLDVAAFRNGVAGSPSHAAIDRTARAAAVELRPAPVSQGAHLVTVRRPAGAPYLLQHYAALSDDTLTVPADGDYLLSTLRPGRGGDDVDLTAILSEVTGGTGTVARREAVIARQTIRLGPEAGWRRRFNLLDPLSLFLEVTRPGRYTLETTGLDVELQLRPLALSGEAGPQLSAPAGGAGWALDAGLYELRLVPRQEGRGSLGLSLHLEGEAEAAEPAPPLLGASFGPFKLRKTARYHRLRLNEAPGAGFGAALRRLPAELAEDVPLVLAPGERRPLPVSLAVAGTLQALSDDNAVLPVRVDGAGAADTTPVGPGIHTVEVANPGLQPVIGSLRAVPAERPAAVALPPMAAATLRQVPDVPLLEPGQPRFLDLGVRQEATFTLKVGAAALYRVETTGLLQTAGTLRTRVQPALARASANGVGRNLLLQHYLREGLYQLTVGTEGATAGHLGIVMTASPMRDGGLLTPGLPARASLGVGEGVTYSLEVAAAGRYHLQALSLTGATAIRLEDAEGWPLTKPDQAGDLSRELAPGRYRLVVLPHPLPGRLLTLVEAEPSPPALAGHGPHPLPLDGSAANRWEEPAGGGPRRPDVWTFALAAEADLSLSLGEPMVGELWRDGDGDGRAVAAVSFRAPWRGRLGAGSYHLDVRSARPNNRLDYTVSAAVTQLTAGRSRTVTAPARVPLALGGGQRVEISSFGAGEVRAVLLDAGGAEVARSGERPGDWNFVIATRPPPGQYLLKIEPMAGTPVATTVRVRTLAEVADAPLAAPGGRILTDGLLHVVPLALKPGDGPLLVAAARSDEPVGLALERRGADGLWQTAASAVGRSAVLALPRDGAVPEDYRLQVWSMDHSPARVALALRALAPLPVSESALAAGIVPVAVPGLEPPLGVAEVRLDSPGLFRLLAPAPGLIWSAAGSGRGLAKGPELVVAGGGSLWFLQPPAAGPIQARRVLPEAGVPLALTLPEGGGAIVPVPADAAGPRLWVADSRVGQPGLALGPRSGGGADGRVSGLAAGVAAVVLPAGSGGEPALRLWRADGSGELPLVLHPFGFGPPEPGSLGWGASDRTLGAGAAQELALPAGAKRLRLALPAHGAAALLRGGAVERVVWSDAGTTQTLDSGADRLLLLNAGARNGHLSLLLTPVGEGAEGLRLAPGVMLRRSLPTAGTLLVELELVPADRGRGLVLRLSGPVEEAMLMQRDGRVRRGPGPLAVDDAAVLLLRHRPGAIVGWLGNGDERAWLQGVAGAPLQPVPATLALAGAETAWRFAAPEPALLHLASTAPVLAGVLRAGAAPDLAVWPEGANLHLFLPAGEDAVVGLRPVQAGALAGAVRITRSAAVPIGEGAGPELRLAPGDARLFTFALEQAGAVGVGVRGDADSARLRLLDPAGRTLAEGTVAMKELAPGRYFLLVENRSDAAASTVQPVLAGVARPGREPPEAVRRHYWDLVTGQEDGPNDDN
ncbi:MAG: hypothetical protein WCO00_05155 [Rhodospirillaceae bacterium]